MLNPVPHPSPMLPVIFILLVPTGLVAGMGDRVMQPVGIVCSVVLVAASVYVDRRNLWWDGRR